MNVLITGSEGFLGKHMCREFKKRGHKVFGLDLKGDPDFRGSVTDLHFLLSVINDIRHVKFCKLDTIIHLAARAIVGDVASSPLTGFEVNIMGTANILEAARLCDVEGVIVASSDKAYGDNKLPYTEDLPLLGCHPYDVSKACADILARSHPYRACVTRCSNIYGPGDLNFSRLIPYTIKCLIQGERPKFYSGTGNVYREYTYVDDTVEAYILLAERMDQVKGEAYNVGSGFKAVRNAVVTQIFSLMDAKFEMELVPAGFKEIRDQSLSSEKIHSLGWQPKVSFAEGLKRTISWYKQYDWTNY